MSDYLFCTSNPRQPGLIQLSVSRDDPRIHGSEGMRTRRALGEHTLEWTLPVVDAGLSEGALRKVLHKQRAKGCKVSFACDAMYARGEAVKLTTVRADPRKRRPSLLRRLIRAA